MIVLNTGTSIFQTSIHQFETKDGVKTTIPHRAKNVRLILGANDIPDADWEEAKKLAVVQHLMSEGTFVEQDNRSLNKRPEKLAVALIKKTFDPDLLAKWHEDDARPEIRKAISAQLKECTLTDEDRKKLRGEKEE